MKVCIVGSGYVGLVSGVCLANQGHEVMCIDSNKEIVSSLNNCIPHIYEDDLERKLVHVINQGLFKASDNLLDSLVDCDIVMIAVGTPSNEDGSINLQNIRKASIEIGDCIKQLKRKIAVIVKSTVLPSTTDTLVKKTIEEASGYKHPYFGLGMNPEFLREGSAINDFNNPDRIVMGYEDDFTLEILKELYEPWKCKKLLVNSRTAEMIKYVNNAMLAVQISSMNEIANLTSLIGGIQIDNVVQGVVSDKRWSPPTQSGLAPEIVNYLSPGCGFGGSCFPKDVSALVSMGKDLGMEMDIFSGVLSVNEKQPHQVVKLLKQSIHDNFAQKKVLVLGLSFKPNTDDIRESPSLKIVDDLLNDNANVYAHDPVAIENFKLNFAKEAKVKFVDNWMKYINDMDAVLLITPWDEYLKLGKLNLEKQLLFDARKVFNETALNVKKYLTIGGSIR